MYLQSRNRDTDVENKTMLIKEGNTKVKWQVGTDIYTLLCRRQWHPAPVLLPRKSHGQRSLVGCDPWGLEESDTTERLYCRFSLSCIGEGNGNPLQCSCLDNSREEGVSWSAIYEFTRSQTQLKWFSSSRSGHHWQ